jgi:hypothetical protein
MDQIFSKMEREEAWVAPYYAGDFLMMQQIMKTLPFTIPSRASISL